MKRSCTLLAGLILMPLSIIAQGRIIGSFPYSQNFSFVTSTTTAFPTTNTDGGEFTADALTSSTFASSITSAGLHNAGGGAIRIQTTTTLTQQGFIFYGDFTGKSAGTFSIDWTKVQNGTAGTRTNDLRIATNGGSGSTFTDIVGAVATFDNSANAQSGTLSFSLPSSLDNNSDARIRIYTINTGGSGNLPRVTVDNLAITVVDRPLPVELASFDVASQSNSIVLSWRTGSEVANAGFEIHRAEGSDSVFHLIASYLDTPELVGLGTTPQGKRYSFIDNDALQPGEIYRYRLVDVSTDGIRTGHEVKSARIESEQSSDIDFFHLDPIAPNPSHGSITLSFHLQQPGEVTVELFAPTGERIPTEIHSRLYQSGGHLETIATDHLPDGFYTLIFTTAQRLRAKSFVVVR
jgi:hypothetical protein